MVVGTAVSVWQAVRATRAESDTASALEVAKSQGERAAAQRERADEQSKLADEQFEFARQAVDAMYTEAAEKWLSQEDKPSPVQQEFLNRALSFYQRFAKAPGRDPEARHKALHASARVGEIQKMLGRLDLAERASAESLAFARGLAAESPDTPEFRRDETEAHRAYGNLLLSRGKTTEAEPILRAGLKLQEAAVAAGPTPENQLSLVSMRTELGHLLEHSQRPDEAEAAHRHGLDILEKLATTHADHDLYRTTLANNQSALGRLLRRMGRLGEADEAYRRCLALIEPWARSPSKDPGTRMATASMLMGWGLVQWELDQLDKAEETIRRAIALDESLVADFPTTPGYRARLAQALAELADLLDDRGQSEDADQTFERARSLLHALIAASPDSSPYRTDLSVLDRRRHFSKGVMRAAQALERFLVTFDPFIRSRPMWWMNSELLRRATRHPGRIRARRLALENLETRQLLSAAEFELSSLLPANGADGSRGFVISGAHEGGELGYPQFNSHAIGDVNEDGVDDFLISAPGTTVEPTVSSRSYLIFGRSGGFPAEINLASLDGTNGYRIDGADPADRAGWQGGGVGDVNGDGKPDFFLLASGKTPEGDKLIGERTFVFFGGAARLDGLDLADGARDGRLKLDSIDGTHGFVISGVPLPGTTGSSQARLNGVGDIDGDGVDDLAIGATYDNVTGGTSHGRVFVVFGRNSTAGEAFPPVLELSTLDGQSGFIIHGLNPGDHLGSAQGGGGDVNGDGFDDLILGATFADVGTKTNAGQGYVIYGRPSFPATFDLATLNGTNGFTVNGGAVGDYLGAYTADVAGDLNGDDRADLVFTAWGVDGPPGHGVGMVYVVFGRPTSSPFPAFLEVGTLDGTNGFAIRGIASTDFVGNATRTGDVNGDGFDDLIVGSPNADRGGLVDVGESYLVYGGPSFPAIFELSGLLAANGGDGSAGYVLTAFQAGGRAGHVAGIGDVNGDGLADVRIGAPDADANGLVDSGQAYIVYGRPSPARPTKFYLVDDASANRTFEYSPTSVPIENYALNSGNSAPRGAASTAAGDKVWVVDANKKVYVYDASGALLGSWTAGGLASNATVEGVATNGTDVWIVDARQDKVFRYAGAASRLSGSQNAAGSFNLNTGNRDPKDVVTDGASFWVLNDSTTDKVFKYNLSGSLLGSWTITGAGPSPTGITLDPTNVGHLWVVDSGTDRVYQFDNAAGRTSGSQSPSTSFALAAGNTNPQGIADPPAYDPSRDVASTPTVTRSARPFASRFAARRHKADRQLPLFVPQQAHQVAPSAFGRAPAGPLGLRSRLAAARRRF